MQDFVDVETRRINYEKKKQTLLEQFNRSRNENGSFSLQKTTSNLFRHRDTKQSQKLDVRSFNQVISIDLENMILETEAMITYEDLVKESLQFSTLPTVVPELKTITIGGAFVGVGIESSSFRYGFVHDTVTEIEVLTGDGLIVTCRPDNEHRNLFFAFANSYGTLGYILKLKSQIIPTKPYVHLSHLHFIDPTLYFQTLHELCTKQRAKEADSFVDGTIFKKDEMVITLGQFTDNAPYLSDYKFMNVYFQSMRTKLEDFLTVSDYIWRWDSDWFWCSKHFGMQNKLLRLLFGKFMLKSAVYWKIKHWSNSNPLLRNLIKFFFKRTESVVQDIVIPIDRCKEFLDFLIESIGITPIWACPYQAFKGKNPFTFVPTDPSILHIDFGFWDMIPSDKPLGYYNRLIEQKTIELNGFKGLYSTSFYSEEEFWKIYSKTEFFQLKSKYDQTNRFKTLFEKCNTK